MPNTQPNILGLDQPHPEFGLTNTGNPIFEYATIIAYTIKPPIVQLSFIWGKTSVIVK